MKSVLLYNLYLVNNWKEVTSQILQNIPQDDVYVNINFDWRYSFHIVKALIFLKKYKKIKHIFFSSNHAKLGEVKGFENFRKNINFNQYNIATYTHSKGVTKPNNKNVAAWREVMRYFVMDKFNDTINVFNSNYALYGVALSQNIKNGVVEKNETLNVSHWYRGTFVSINLKKIRNAFLTTPIQQNFYGIEAFFGDLCSFEECYNAHEINISLYNNYYSEDLYKNK